MQTVDGFNHYGEPRAEFERALRLAPGNARILDIGAGLGNNVAVALGNERTLVATETSPDCLIQLQALRDRHAGRIDVRDESVTDLDVEGEFDLVSCTMVLHFVNAELGTDALSRVMAAVKPGGLCVVTTYLEQPGLSDAYRWLLTPGQLRRAFGGWEIEFYAESRPFTLRRVKTSRELLRWLRGHRGFAAARIIARRPERHV